MDYHDRMTIRRSYGRDNGKQHVSLQCHYLPAIDRKHAECMVDALNQGSVRRFGNVFDHTFEVVASVWTGKGRVYLDTICLEQIADEYTKPEHYAKAAE